VGCGAGYAEVRMMAGSHGKLFGLLPYDFRPPTLTRLRRTLWNREDERFLVPIYIGVGWSVNLRCAARHPLQVLLLAALILWRLGVRRDSVRGR
jgi:hypothetical protein